MRTKRKILWFCAAQFSDKKIKTTGTWLIAMGNAIAKNADIELYNVTYGNVKSIVEKSTHHITQWIVPHNERIKYHQGSKVLISFIKKIDNEIKPDLIHIWGTENGFGFAVVEAKLQVPVLLDIQGLLSSIGSNYYGGLSNKDLLRCIGLKEILRPKNHPHSVHKKFVERGYHERFLIGHMENISVQSEWVDSIIRYLSPNSNIFRTGIMLRDEFYETAAWEYNGNSQNINIFTSCSGAIPYKGLHLIFDAIALLKNKYPNIRLNIGGNIEIEKKNGIIRDGYTGWLLKKADQLGITDSISWLGMMDADEMIREMKRSSLVVVPSFIESYCLFMAESMIVGVPIVASFAGAMPELAENNKSALYFPIGDYWACAQQIEKIITNQELAEKLSIEARCTAVQRNDKTTVLQTQLDIYNRIIHEL